MPSVPLLIVTPNNGNKCILHKTPKVKRVGGGESGFPRRRGRRMATVHLGSRRGLRSGGRLIVGFLRRVRVRWLACRYMKRLKSYYSQLVKDIVDGAATMESVQARILMETYFAVPVMPMSLTAGNAFGAR